MRALHKSVDSSSCHLGIALAAGEDRLGYRFKHDLAGNCRDVSRAVFDPARALTSAAGASSEKVALTQSRYTHTPLRARFSARSLHGHVVETLFAGSILD